MAEKKESKKTVAKVAPKKRAPSVAKTAAPGSVSASAAGAPGAIESRKPVKKYLRGVVVSDKMQKTIVVRVDRRVKHPFFGKFMVSSRRFKAHDEKNEARNGDLVSIVETRPVSRDKRWALMEILKKSALAPDLHSVGQ
jgi:small subunit ribosomal protein S17